MFDGGYRKGTRPVVRRSGKTSLTKTTSSHFRLATYNVWFGELAFEVRARALCDLLAKENMDLIALQEVTPEFLHILREQKWASDYLFSTLDEAQVSPYGNLLLTRDQGSKFDRVALWSYQGRHINMVRLTSGHCIGTVHLESQRHNGEIRCTQLSDIFSTLDENLTILLGDFNFDDGSEEESHRPRDFADAWPKLHLPAHGPTFDTTRNAMARSQSGREKQVRFDRIWFRKSAATIVSIKRIGLAPISQHERIWPSDHFGLVADFTLSDENQPQK